MRTRAHIVVNMLILQFSVTQADETEVQMIPNFCQWISSQIFSRLDTKINRSKIESRLGYIKSVPWIHWISNKNITINDIMSTIEKGFIYKQHKEVSIIEFDGSILIPHTDTPMVRLVRFINSGDMYHKGTGMFSNIQNKYKHNDLNTYWKMYIMQELGYLPSSEIIAM